MSGPDPAQPAGDGMRELVALMHLLRSPGGCPWDAAQTHESLAPYALEEAYEVVEAIEAGDRAGLREELGDLLLQVVFHARLAQEDPADPFDLDDVARAVAAKLVRRHPDVFAPAAADAATGSGAGVEDAHTRWDRIKTAEKQRTYALDGIPVAQSALARAQKVVARTRRAGLDVDVVAVAREHRRAADAAGTDVATADLGARLLLIAHEAAAGGVDAEAALRGAVRCLEERLRAGEARRVAPRGPVTS